MSATPGCDGTPNRAIDADCRDGEPCPNGCLVIRGTTKVAAQIQRLPAAVGEAHHGELWCPACTESFGKERP